jgi:hypothetical protein
VEHIAIDRPRKDLARVRNPEAIGSLSLHAPLADWQGIDRLSNLALIEIARGTAPVEGLTPLGRLRALRSLTLHCDDATAGLDALGETPLRRLRVFDHGDGGGLERIVASPPRNVETLTLVLVENSPRGLDLRTLRLLESLRELTLTNVLAACGNSLFDGGFRALERLQLTVRDASEGTLVQSLRPDVSVFAVPYTDASRAPAIIEEGGRFHLFCDLADVVGAETNYEATDVLINRLRDRDARLLARLSFDPEAGGVGISADDRSSLERLLTMLHRDSDGL